MRHFALSQDPPLKCWDTFHCPKTPHSSVGTLRIVPRLPAQVFRLFVLSQDLSFKCWDTSRCPKTFRSIVGTLHAVPRPFVPVLGHFTLSQELVLGHLALYLRPYTLVLGHLALSQVLTLKCWDTSHCPTTIHSSVGTLHDVARSSVGTPRTVPRPLTQTLGHFALSHDPSSKCWDTSYCPRTSRPTVGKLRTVP